MDLDARYSRRDFVALTAGLAAMGLTTSLTPDLLHAQAGSDLKGVTIDYWNMIGVQNPIVKRLSASIVKAFQQRTGVKVKLTWDTYGSIIGPKYRTNFLAGKIPTVFDGSNRWSGQLRSFLRPMNDFIAGLDPQTHAAIAWLLPLVEQQNRGYPDADQIYDLPFTLIPQAPFVTRLDHWEQAGLDFGSNWPIRDTDHLVEVLTALQSVTAYPYEVYGKIWDAGDTQLNGWVRSLDIPNSDFINADWSRSTCDTDAWITAAQFYVDLYRKHGFSSPNTPQSTDESRGGAAHSRPEKPGARRHPQSWHHPAPFAARDRGRHHPVGTALPDGRWHHRFDGISGHELVQHYPAGGARRRRQGVGRLGIRQGMAVAGESDRPGQEQRLVRSARPVGGAERRPRPLYRGRHLHHAG